MPFGRLYASYASATSCRARALMWKNFAFELFLHSRHHIRTHAYRTQSKFSQFNWSRQWFVNDLCEHKLLNFKSEMHRNIFGMFFTARNSHTYIERNIYWTRIKNVAAFSTAAAAIRRLPRAVKIDELTNVATIRAHVAMCTTIVAHWFWI